MDNTKLEKLIADNMKAIFGFSLTRLGRVDEAERLSSDILYEIVRSAPTLREETRFYGFMWKIAENTYKDYLRKRAREASQTVELDETVTDPSESIVVEIINREELNLLRRELSLLSKQYRDVTVLYYMENLSCSEIAKKLSIGTEMVKYYLFRARKIIREGMNMERLYGEKSYRPNHFEIDFWGSRAGDDREYQEFQKRKIKGNILLAAYYTPVTASEIGIELGVSLPYLEDEIRLLMDRQYLICKNGKYLTNIPIFTPDCTKAIDEKLKSVAEDAAKRFVAVTDMFPAKCQDWFENENLMRWQKVLMSLHFSLLATASDLEKTYGKLPNDGPYSLVNGGGGQGIVWGRDREFSGHDSSLTGIQGIYNGSSSKDGRGSVIAMNFRQTLNGQHFQSRMTDPIVCAAVGCFDTLPTEWQEKLLQLGYVKNGKPNFAVYSEQEYRALSDILNECIEIVSSLTRKTSEIAATVTADLAPSHIRKTAEYVGAFVYQFHSLDHFVSILCDMNWLKEVDDREKPAICVVKK